MQVFVHTYARFVLIFRFRMHIRCIMHNHSKGLVLVSEMGTNGTKWAQGQAVKYFPFTPCENGHKALTENEL